MVNFKKKIQAHHATISSVAKALGITQSALSQQINNKSITLEKTKEIAHIIGCSLSELVSDNEKGLTALVEYNSKLKSAHSLQELKDIVAEIEQDDTKKEPPKD